MNQLGFAIANIRTKEFAILEENFNQEMDDEFSTGFRIAANAQEKFIAVNFEVQFKSQKKTVIKLAVECAFEIEENTFKSFLNEEKEEVSIPGVFCRHLAVITVGTTRGILHEKLNETQFEDVILPSINVTEHIQEETVILKSK